MTTREDFEKWFKGVESGDGTIDLPKTTDGAKWDEYVSRHQLALGAWQACAAHYEAKIALYEAAELYDEAPDDAEFQPPHPIFQLAQERDSYAEQLRNALAVIAQKDAALRELRMSLDPSDDFIGDKLMVEHIADALSLTHDSVRLKEVGYVDRVTRPDQSAEFYEFLDDGTKLYTIVKGEAG